MFQVIPQTLNPSSNTYVQFRAMKSSTTTVYKRSFNKIDELFSYVGGLIGTILGFMLFMGNFTLMAFELDISAKFFKRGEDDNEDLSSFNIFSYFKYLLFKFGSFFGYCKNWKEMNNKIKCKN